MCEKCRRDCDDCQRLLQRFSEYDLTICEDCGHYVSPLEEFCSCKDPDDITETSLAHSNDLDSIVAANAG